VSLLSVNIKGLREPFVVPEIGGVPVGGEAMAIERVKGVALRGKGLADEVYDVLFKKLMLLEISPGSRITVDNLVRELGVSQTPIREALGRLEGEGLVVKAHLVGYSAAPQISRRKFDELYELRLLLEPFAARQAALNMKSEALDSLRRIALEMSELGTNKRRIHYSSFARLDAAFHDEMLAAAGNQLVRETLAHLHTHFQIFRLIFRASVTEEALNEHAAILAAFDRKDGDVAEFAMRDHIGRSRERLLQAFEE